jgi:PST family polysaccharide transporter/lipopolysaccharide exporter
VTSDTVPPTPAGLERGVRRAGARALGWQSLSTIVVQVVQAVVTIVVAALTTPSEFALWGIAAVVFNAQNVIGTLGLGQALIYVDSRERRQDAVDGAFVLTAGIAVVVGGLIALGAPAVAGALGSGFDHDDVVAVVQVMSLVFVFTTVTGIPQALIERELDFRRRAIPEIGGALLYLVLAGILLATGAGVWSLIVAKVVQTGLVLVAYWVVAPIRPRLVPRWHGDVVGELFRYGKFITAGGLVTFATGNLDTVAAGVLGGARDLGAYALAFTIANIAPTFLTQTTGRVFFPLYAAVRADEGRLRESFALSLHVLSLVMLPVTAGLVLVAPDLLVRVFGGEWEHARAILQVLALYGLLRAFGSAPTVLLAATGRADLTLVTQAVTLVASLVALVPLAGQDALGVAIAFAVGQAASALVAVVLVRAHLTADVLRASAAPAIGTGAAVAAALVVRLALDGAVETWTAAAAFLVVYAGVVAVLDDDVRDGLGRVRRLRGAV